MEAIVTIGEVVLFILLVYAYYRLSHNREIHFIGKLVEVIALYGVSFWAVVCNFKFVVWVLLIGAIGTIKFLTTKKQKIERRT